MATRVALSLLLWVAAGIAPAVDAADSGARDAAKRFYETYLKLNPRGLPSEEQMRALESLLSRELVQAIGKARQEQQKFIREHPEEKPPWIEGNLFASCYEGVSSFALGEPVVSRDKASVPVYLTYREGGQEERWLDVVVLEQTGNQWLVRDIFLNGPWEFRSGPSLRALLTTE